MWLNGRALASGARGSRFKSGHPDTMEGFSLWVTAQGNTQKRLEAVVKDLSKKFKGPNFEPHMTLLGPIPEGKEEVIRKAQIFARKIAPFKLTLGNVDYSSTYFQCVFIRVKTSIPLLEARMAAQKAFNIGSLFMPHISLYYGDVSPKVREKIAKSIKLPNLSFIVDRIIVTPATLDPSKWKHLAEIPLSSFP